MTDHTNPDMANAVELATELTIAWLGNPNTRTDAEHVPAFLGTMHAAIVKLAGGTANAEPEAAAPQEYTPAVSVRKSLASSDHIISMIDGKPYKTLRRHLSTHGLTPEEYRERYSLKADYPMVAQSYSESRRAMAKKIGLGRKPGAKAPAAKSKNIRSAKDAAQAHLSGE
ncbi:transcriptional regulator [Sphingomonas yabuuchiae]|uniref:Transcriptional regulator n=1 Tax=Sphingomonas yabuuchiae TaxID=172044 RepID=A0A147IP36_9SPHN|nr:MucR family transcriptional regulator [Sphingomonas yabuuchiae]KTT96836.1 transcriptional regulator [Sphingomonas yabuuchiae]